MRSTVPDPGSLTELKRRVRARKAALLDQFGKNRPTATSAAHLVRALARQIDDALAELWRGAAMPPGATLVAVGGYGRGELFPYSDVDVLVLLPAGNPLGSEHWRDAVSGFITHCWDIGLEIGSSVRTVAECLAESARDVTRVF